MTGGLRGVVGAWNDISVQPSHGMVVDRYVLYDAIASGGMATVHLARLRGQVGFARTVAIKRLHPALANDPAFTKMFLDEAHLAARIRHPNVVPILDVLATRGELFLVMEYVAGESLAHVWKAAAERGKSIPIPVVVGILSGVLQGLHAAHEARDEHGALLGIVHRDVSPQNILVGTDGQARLIDFGVAKAAGRLQTTAEGGRLKGKLRYMAPERLERGPVSRQSDLYATAVGLWEALTMRRLFDLDSEGAVVRAIMSSRIALPSQVHGAADAFFDPSSRATLERLDRLVLKGLAPDPEARYATAREMAQALEACVAPATPVQIAAWMESTVGDVLRARAQALADIERGVSLVTVASGDEPTAVHDAPAATHDAPTDAGADARSASARGRSTRVIVAAGAVALAALSAVSIGIARRGAVGHASAASPSSTPPTPQAELAPAGAPIVGAPSASGASAERRTDAGALSTVPARLPTSPAAAVDNRSGSRRSPVGPSATPALGRSSAAISSCVPPYTWDRDGTKIYKPECM